MVAVNLNEGQKPCELSDAYPAILRDSSLCGQEGSGGEVEADYCLCPPVTGYGEVPDHTVTGLSNRAQAFGWTGMEEGDGLAMGPDGSVFDGDASEGSGESEGAGEGKDAKDSKDASDSDKAPGCIDPAIDAARGARDAARPDSVSVEFDLGIVSVGGTWDTSDKGDSSSNGNESDHEGGVGGEPGGER